VLDLGSLPRVSNPTSNTAEQISAEIRETQQGSPAIAGHITTREIGLDDPSSKAWNRQLNRGTIWHGGASLCF